MMSHQQTKIIGLLSSMQAMLEYTENEFKYKSEY